MFCQVSIVTRWWSEQKDPRRARPPFHNEFARKSHGHLIECLRIGAARSLTPFYITDKHFGWRTARAIDQNGDLRISPPNQALPVKENPSWQNWSWNRLQTIGPGYPRCLMGCIEVIPGHGMSVDLHLTPWESETVFGINFGSNFWISFTGQKQIDWNRLWNASNNDNMHR